MTAGMTVGNVETSSGAIVTDLTRDGKTLAVAGALTLMTMASIATAVVITVKDSVGATFRPIVNMAATIEVDGNRLAVYCEAVKQRIKKPPAEKSAASYVCHLPRAPAVFADDYIYRAFPFCWLVGGEETVLLYGENYQVRAAGRTIHESLNAGVVFRSLMPYSLGHHVYFDLESVSKTLVLCIMSRGLSSPKGAIMDENLMDLRQSLIKTSTEFLSAQRVYLDAAAPNVGFPQ